MMAENVGVKIGKLETRMDKVEEGVSNFRAFQVEARDFFTRSDERAKAEQKFHGDQGSGERGGGRSETRS